MTAKSKKNSLPVLHVSSLQGDILEHMPLGEWVDEFKIGEEVAKKRKESGEKEKTYGPREDTWVKLEALGAIKRRNMWTSDFSRQPDVMRIMRSRFNPDEEPR